MDDFDAKLSALRAQIDDIDTQLVELLARRRQVTGEVGALKSQVGMPIFAPAREGQLINNRRQQAKAQGLNPELVEDLLRRIMRDSYISQDEKGYRQVNPQCKKIFVIGGLGQLGQVFVRLFSRTGYAVEVIDKDDWHQRDNLFADASLVLVAVPINLTLEVIARLTQLPEDCILADVTSIKDSPLKAMLATHAGPVVGLHPMFGPDVTGLVKQTVIVCHGRQQSGYHWLMEQLSVWGAKLCDVSPAEHDQAMSLVQVMRHFSTISYGHHLMAEGANISQLVEMSSPIYRLELIMVGRLFAQNPELYRDIIFANKDNVAMMKRYGVRFLELLDAIENGDQKAFMQVFEDVALWFGDYAQTFLKESKLMLQKADDLKDQ
jgi:chorismate mutase/prephenate dehydrogenase